MTKPDAAPQGATRTDGDAAGQRRWLRFRDLPWPVVGIVGILVMGIRIIMLVPVVATQVAALCLLGFGAIETWHFAAELVAHEGTGDHNEVLYQAIEIIDLFLVATVAEVVSLGFYQLYFRQEPTLPAWLKIETLDDLKAKLVGVTVTVLAVYFLGQALLWTSGQDIAWLGLGTAAVVAALTLFLARIEHR